MYMQPGWLQACRAAGCDILTRHAAAALANHHWQML